MSFENKVVLVTGASAGIGEATAILFAKHKAKVALVGRNEANLQKVSRCCLELFPGNKPLIIVADLATDPGCELTAKRVLEHYGRLDVLVNNAGVGARTCIERDRDMSNFDTVFATNVRGVYNLTRLLVPALVASKGNIINVSSVSATTCMVGSLPYGMAKAALDHFTRLIANELGPKGVRVNTVSPGVTITTFVQRLTNYTDEEYKEWVNNIEKQIPMRKACTSEHIASMIVHLASDACELVTGTNVEVDGGVRFVSPLVGFQKQIAEAETVKKN